MGVAEVIPGISGGTLALILGVYERLINALRRYVGLNFYALFINFIFHGRVPNCL